MSTPGEGPPSLGGQGAPQQHGYDPRSNGLTRQPTNPLDMESSQNPSSQRRHDAPSRSLTDPERQQHDPAKEKPKRSKICGKCGEGLTGQFVRALGDTYHLECFTCHVGAQRHKCTEPLEGRPSPFSSIRFAFIAAPLKSFFCPSNPAPMGQECANHRAGLWQNRSL